MSSQTYDDRKLESLGAALRDARMECYPHLTLADLGMDPAAPRNWSHSHLSKVERGLEAPKEDLVRWYEIRTGKPTGYLMNIFYEATGGTKSRASLDNERSARQWSIDRLEIFADLTGENTLIYETRDLIAVSDGVASHSMLIDTRDRVNPGEGYGMEVIEGGVVTKEPEWISDTLAKLEINFDRSFSIGEWHRVRLLHRSPPPASIPRWMTVASRYGETREAVVSVAFNERDVRPAWRISENHSAEVVTTFEAGSPAVVEDIIGGGASLVTDATGIVRARFMSLRPGLHYGIGWR
ncbi:MAG: hypothetical protein HIU84_01020 [Acidobacteria bacterium]|nr:hypothetical protein [Acidobacteriota bacterium]